MNNYSRGGGFGAKSGKNFGGGNWNRGGFGGDRDGGGERPLHDATCAKCNRPCQVPFRPNGRKPIYCQDCFVRDEDPGAKRFERRDAPRPSYGAPERSYSRPAPAADNSALEAQLKQINAKLDALLEALADDVE